MRAAACASHLASMLQAKHKISLLALALLLITAPAAPAAADPAGHRDFPGKVRKVSKERVTIENRQGDRRSFVRGKKTKVRVVPLSQRVRKLLEAHFALDQEFPIGKRRAQDLVKAVANRAGISKEVTPHVLRHTFAATALQKGISLATVQKILGHDRLQTTAIYLNFTDAHIQEEFERKW